MTAIDTEKISVGQFLAALKQQGPVSALINAAHTIDVDGATDAELKEFAAAMRDFAATKNGPMLIMGLPGPMQALLDFADLAMPGLDRLGYLRATPRQIVRRLLTRKDERVLKRYPFAKVGKEDWSYYLEHCEGEPVAPCVQYLGRSEEAGGFSHGELVKLAHHCDAVSKWIDPDKVAFSDFYELYNCGKGLGLWQRFPFEKLNRQDWDTLLSDARIPIPSQFSSAVKAGMFSVAELCGYAKKNEAIVSYLPIAQLNVESLTELLIVSTTEKLWTPDSLKRLTADCWVKLIQMRTPLIPAEHLKPLRDTKDLTPQHVDTILDVDRRYYRYVPSNLVSTERACAYFTSVRADELWNTYDFKRFSDAQIKAIVGKSPRRDRWPKEISDKFSSSKGSFTDDEILSLSENGIANVLALLTVERIQESGTKFFGTICTVAKNSKSAGAVITQKLSEGTKPWLELRQEYLLVLLLAVPQLRQFVSWQGFERKHLDKLVSSNKTFRAELRGWCKFKLYVWRYWPYLVVTAIAIVCLWRLMDRANVLCGPKRSPQASVQRVHTTEGRTGGSVAQNVDVGRVDASPPKAGNSAQATPVKVDAALPTAYQQHDNDKEEKEQVEVLHNVVACLRGYLHTAHEERFMSVEREFSQLENRIAFARYKREYTKEYEELSSGILKRRNGINNANAIIADVASITSSGYHKKATEIDVEKDSEMIERADTWKHEFCSIVPWKMGSIEDCRKRICEHRDNLKERIELVSAINNAKTYDDLYRSIQRLLQQQSDCFEGRQIDGSRIASPEQVKTAITKSGWFTDEVFCEFVGLIKVGTDGFDDVVPTLCTDVPSTDEIYFVVLCHDADTQKWVPKVRRIFTRTGSGGFRKVWKVDYSHCQGIGLFVCKDPSYVDAETWTPGEANPRNRLWVASSKPGVWVEEPGYEKKSIFGGELSEVEWRAHKTYLCGTVRSGNYPGKWQKRVGCGYCAGSGKVTSSEVIWKCSACKGSGRLQRKMKCEKCSACEWRGYKWSEPYTCTECRGKGKRYDSASVKCTHCSGKRFCWVDIEDANESARVVQSIVRSL